MAMADSCSSFDVSDVFPFDPLPLLSSQDAICPEEFSEWLEELISFEIPSSEKIAVDVNPFPMIVDPATADGGIGIVARSGSASSGCSSSQAMNGLAEQLDPPSPSSKPCPGDDVELRREMRKNRNREHASMSRQRKREYVKDLEKKGEMLEVKCKQMEKSVAFVMAENAALREELKRCKRMEQNHMRNGETEPAVPFRDSPQLEFLSPNSFTHCQFLKLVLAQILMIWAACGNKFASVAGVVREVDDTNMWSQFVFVTKGVQRLKRHLCRRHIFWVIDSYCSLGSFTAQYLSPSSGVGLNHSVQSFMHIYM